MFSAGNKMIKKIPTIIRNQFQAEHFLSKPMSTVKSENNMKSIWAGAHILRCEGTDDKGGNVLELYREVGVVSGTIKQFVMKKTKTALGFTRLKLS